MLNCFSCNADINDTLAQEPCLCDTCIADINAGNIPESYFADDDAPRGWDEIEADDDSDDDFAIDDSDILFDEFPADWSEYEEYLDMQEAKDEMQGVYAHDLHFGE